MTKEEGRKRDRERGGRSLQREEKEGLVEYGSRRVGRERIEKDWQRMEEGLVEEGERRIGRER